MIKGNYEVEVLVNGSSTKEFLHKGKIFIEGKEGSHYRIRVKNNGYSRIKAVVSVDGLSVLDGQPATLLGRGYIISGRSALIIDGWRSSDDKVNEFFFTDHSNSYSVRSENGGENLGIIGVAIVEENQQHWTGAWDEMTFISPLAVPNIKTMGVATTTGNTLTASGVNTAYSYNASAGITNAVGTGWGKEKESQVQKVSFNGKSQPSEVFEINYDSMNGLRKRGVDIHKRPVYVDGPQAFPGEYCKPPIK